ncbi:MAG: GNAT family N-acetyltransferase [Acidimicrobiales bacterium]
MGPDPPRGPAGPSRPRGGGRRRRRGRLRLRRAGRRGRGRVGGRALRHQRRPEAWGRGLGRALLAAATDRLRREGFDRVVLWVEINNARARRFYERAGWSVTGEEQDDVVQGASVRDAQYEHRLAR